MSLDFLKFNNLFFFQNYIFKKYMIKIKIDDHIIKFN